MALNLSLGPKPAQPKPGTTSSSEALGLPTGTLGHFGSAIVGGALKGAGAVTGVNSLYRLGANIQNPTVNSYGTNYNIPQSPRISSGGGSSVLGSTSDPNLNTDGTYNPVAGGDPYAGTPFGSTTNFNQANADYQALKGNTYGSFNDAISNTGRGLSSGILDYLDSLKTAQTGIDNKSIQNELSRNQGYRGVAETVGQGIRSGGVQLANRNASNSSATDALARAYATLGRGEMSKIGNQYSQGQTQIGQDQQSLQDQTGTYQRKFGDNKVDSVNSIVSQAQNALGQLNQAAATASLPDRINIEQEKETIRNQALAALQQYDQQLSQGISGVHALSSDQVRSRAQNLAVAGTAPENSFNFSDQMPGQFQGSGPFASELPLFSFSGNKKPQLA